MAQEDKDLFFLKRARISRASAIKILHFSNQRQIEAFLKIAVRVNLKIKNYFNKKRLMKLSKKA